MTLLIEKLHGLPQPAELFAPLSSLPGSFLLDSGLPLRGLGAYSILGFSPFLTFRAEGGRGLIWEEGAATATMTTGDPLDQLRELLGRFPAEAHARFPFVGGAVGYLSYEYGAGLEKITPRRDVDGNGNDGGTAHTSGAASPGMPDAEFSFHDGVLVYDHGTREWWLIANPVHQRSAGEIRSQLLAALENNQRPPASAPPGSSPSLPTSGLSESGYISAVGRIKDYIAAGDVYQVNLAHRFDGEWPDDPYRLFQALRQRTPAPFAAFVSTSFGRILSSSPERFLSLRGRSVETRPIKGTRRKGANPEETQHLAAELEGSAKERAELLMIVDLERNDLGRVCVPGSISVERLYELEEHPTVLHLVATVRGTLRPGCDAFDLLRAAFPGGSITGAPKIRAMQIIRELEVHPRHVYTGALGYLGFDGGCDFNIPIRTVILQGTRASYHVGAGIVWDSDPKREYEETLLKGRALQAAFETFSRP